MFSVDKSQKRITDSCGLNQLVDKVIIDHKILEEKYNGLDRRTGIVAQKTMD